MIEALVKSDKVIFSKNRHARSSVSDQFHLVHSNNIESPYYTGYVRCVSFNSLMKHDLARSGTTHLQQHTNRCKGKSKTAYQPSSSSSSLHQHKIGSFFQPKCKIPAKLKEKVCDAVLDFIVHDIRPPHAIEGKGLQSLVSAYIEIGGKCGNVTVDTILPSRSTVKRKLDDKCKLVKSKFSRSTKSHC